MVPLIFVWITVLALISNPGVQQGEMVETIGFSLRVGLLSSILTLIIGYSYIALVFAVMNRLALFGKRHDT